MSVTLSYVERLKAAHGAASDYRAAKLLGVTHQAISQWRHGRARMSDATALRLARLLGLPEVEVVADLHIEAARDEEEKQFWEGLKRLH